MAPPLDLFVRRVGGARVIGLGLGEKAGILGVALRRLFGAEPGEDLPPLSGGSTEDLTHEVGAADHDVRGGRRGGEEG